MMKHSELPEALQRTYDRMKATGVEFTEEDTQVFLAVAQLAARMAKASAGDDHGLTVTTVVSRATGEGKLDVVWFGVLAQMTPDDARSTGWVLVEAAALAEAEAGFYRFMREQVGATPEATSVMLQEFRTYRDRDPHGTLVPNPAKPTH